jgi:hypothetical protein
MRRAAPEENQKSQQLLFGIWDKWKKDPGVTFLCYYLKPGVGHHIIFEVDDVNKVAEMDADMWQTKGLLIETYSFEIGLGNTEFDERWIS